MPIGSMKVELVRQPLGQDATTEPVDMRGVSSIKLTDYAGYEYVITFVGGDFGEQHKPGIKIDPPVPFDIIRGPNRAITIEPEPF